MISFSHNILFLELKSSYMIISSRDLVGDKLTSIQVFTNAFLKRVNERRGRHLPFSTTTTSSTSLTATSSALLDHSLLLLYSS